MKLFHSIMYQKKNDFLLGDDIFSVINLAKNIVIEEGKKLIVLFLNTKNKLDKRSFVGGFRQVKILY